MRNGVPERFHNLAGYKSAPSVAERARSHDRNADAVFDAVPVDGKQAGLEIQRVDERLGQQNIDSGFNEGRDLRVIRPFQLVKTGAAPAWVVYFGRNRALPRRGSDGAGDEARLIRRPLVELIDCLPGTSDGG